MKRTFTPAIYILSLIFIAATGAACDNAGSKRMTHINGFGIGTFYMISVKGDTIPGTRHIIDSALEAASESMSVFDENSLLSRLNNNLTDTLDPHISYCIELARSVSEMSGGLYDITILPLVEAYGLGTKRDGNATADRHTIDSLLQYVGYKKISIRDGKLVKQNPDIRIDLNSIAKGYIVDMVAKAVEQTGATEYMVNIGGEIYCKGSNGAGEKWKVGIETPAEGNFVLLGGGITSMVEFTGMGMATSGNYRNFREDSLGNRYTHIVNPLTGDNTASRLLSSTVIEQSCALADALSTMFIAVGFEDGKQIAEQYNIPALFIYTADSGDTEVWHSSSMKRFTGQ